MAGYKNFQVDRNKNKNSIFTIGNKCKAFDNMTKQERLMDGVDKWASFYRWCPDKFAELLGLKLHPFQVLVLRGMFRNNYTMFLASRGLGKTYLTTVFCILYCILYPNSKIVIASYVKAQAMKVVTEKLPEICDSKPLIKREIKEVRSSMSNDDKPNVVFVNGSTMKIVVANENARSARANVLILDEFRMIDPKIYTNVLRKFLTVDRQPKFKEKYEYKNYQVERNKEIFLTSCYFKHNWAYEKFWTFLKAVIKGKKYVVYGFPYQMSIKEGLSNKEQILDEIDESDFDDVGWLMEMDCMFYGQAENAYFKIEDMETLRVCNPPLYPKDYYGYFNDKKFRQETKKTNEVRMLCCDIATIAGSNNDASSFIVLRGFRDKKGYIVDISYMENIVGGHIQSQSNRIRQLYYDFDCDYIVLDRQNVGLAIYENLTIPYYDKDRGITYEPMSSINDKGMQDRCLYDDAKQVIYTIAASASFNDEIARALKDRIARQRIHFLGSKDDMYEYFDKYPDYNKLPVEIKVKFESNYEETKLLINEMVSLEKTMYGELIKLRTKGRNRKDRYTALAYGNYIFKQLEQNLFKPNYNSSLSNDISELNKCIGRSNIVNDMRRKIFK